MEKPVFIEAYTSDWTSQFQKERELLIGIIGHEVIAIEHIGSTSVEGLGAKPIIDIAIGVNDLEVVNEIMEPLEQMGYEFVFHKEFPERRFFRKGKWGAGTHHLHFYKFEGEHWNNQILFRNYLRNHPAVSKKYYQLKVNLAERFRFDRVLYTENKTAFIQDVLLRAKREN